MKEEIRSTKIFDKYLPLTREDTDTCFVGVGARGAAILPAFCLA
jgi:hypothetical protein